MNKTQHSNALLVEIIIAVLIFGLASTVVLNVFGVSYKQSREAGMAIDSLAQAQSLADALYVSDDPEALLAAEGYAQAEDVWTLAAEDYTVEVRVTETEEVSGVWRETTVRVLDGDTAVLELPCSRYICGEAAK